MKTRCVCVLMLIAASAWGETNAELKEQVQRTEAAFAKTMADRDAAAFAKFVADEAVFVGLKELRGVQQVK